MAPTTLDAQETADIQQLYARQMQAIDAGEAEAWAQTFAPEGTFSSPSYGRTYTGRQELRGFAEAFARSAAKAGATRRHWTNALLLERDGQGGVTARCYALILASRTGAPVEIERCVVLHDRLERADGGWRFTSRRVEVDGAPSARAPGDG